MLVVLLLFFSALCTHASHTLMLIVLSFLGFSARLHGVFGALCTQPLLPSFLLHFPSVLQQFSTAPCFGSLKRLGPSSVVVGTSQGNRRLKLYDYAVILDLHG